MMGNEYILYIDGFLSVIMPVVLKRRKADHKGLRNFL
jgi:hypothetical protein